MKKLIILLLGVLLMGCNESELEDTVNDLGTPSLPEPGGTTSKVVVFHDSFEGKEIVLAGNARDLYIVSFEREIDGKKLDFSSAEDALPVIMEDNEGNKWDIFGYAVSGPRIGQRLTPTTSLMGYWFSFATFYPGLIVYPQSEHGPNEGEVITGSGSWLIPENEVRSGGVGRDGIPAVSSPEFEDSFKASFLEGDDLVVGITDGKDTKAYPHDVLDWHEIVNDELEGIFYSIIYCPLTGTATAWDRNINGKVTTFGVSGLLYNTNIIPYDRATNSNWSQLFDAAVFGELRGIVPEKHMVLETKWETWEAIYPSSKIMNFNTGYSRSYGSYPYGSYKEEASLIFPVKYDDNRLHRKERVHALIVNGKAKVYRFESF